MKALNEMRKLTNVVRPRLPMVKCPTMLIHTKKDLTSLIDNFYIVKNEISSEKQKELILENSNHNLFANGPEQNYIFDNVVSFLNKNSLN